ncbi:MFS transporter [Acerihabitans sp. TG2]|uniref:MFS transporter n=1 Tax=Acerihabitans sp. TG2 TaxID=3096008 RepID=UPI002B232671|nr:MFS transporter [Acerihabitans sp. TG2]MEA9390638.1 MFS transporter [Acerihabitans sp. TG2]
MSVYSRPVVMLLTGLLSLTIAIAVLNTLVPLWLSHESMPTWQIGLVGSSYFTGNFVGTLLAGVLIKWVGFNRSYHYACLLFAAATLGLAITVEFNAWLVCRFIAGVACALIWVVVESALMRSGTVRTRGQLLAAYMMTYYMGTVIGQLLLSGVSTALLAVLPWAAALTIAAIMPVLFHRIGAQGTEAPRIAIWPMLRRRNARLGINGCIISGVVLGSLYGLLPLFLSHQGLSDGNVGYWMALLVSAGILGQWPIGRLADRYGRLMVLRVQIFMVIVGSLSMLSNDAMAPALFVLGCSGFTLYPVAMAWACEQVDAQELVAMNQALLLSYTVGSLVGPSATAMLMQRYSDPVLFVMIACVALVYLAMLLRKGNHHHTPVTTA